MLSHDFWRKIEIFRFKFTQGVNVKTIEFVVDKLIQQSRWYGFNVLGILESSSRLKCDGLSSALIGLPFKRDFGRSQYKDKTFGIGIISLPKRLLTTGK